MRDWARRTGRGTRRIVERRGSTRRKSTAKNRWPPIPSWRRDTPALATYTDTGEYQRSGRAKFNKHSPLDTWQCATQCSVWRKLSTSLGNTQAAEATYKKAISLRPQYWAVYNWLGAFYAGQAQICGCGSHVQKGYRLTPDNQARLLQSWWEHTSWREDTKKPSMPYRRSIELTTDYGCLQQPWDSLLLPAPLSGRDRGVRKGPGLDDKDFMNWGNLGDALYWSPDRRPESAAAYKRAIELAASANPGQSQRCHRSCLFGRLQCHAGGQIRGRHELRQSAAS